MHPYGIELLIGYEITFWSKTANMEGASAITAFSSVLASTVKIAEKTFEICAVDSQAKAVLATINQCSSQLNDARILRRQKSSDFSTFEKQMIDNTFKHTEEAIKEVASLAERARADIVTGGKIRVNTRLLYVLRDSPNIHVGLTKLGIANQSLNMALFMLTSRESRSSTRTASEATPQRDPDLKPPPTYEESTFLSEWRRRNMSRRASALSLKTHPHSSSSLPQDTPWSSEKVLECEAEEPFPEFSMKRIPSISVSGLSPTVNQMDFDLFQQATSFYPPPSQRAGPRPQPTFTSQMEESEAPEEPDFIEFAGFTPRPPHQTSPPAHPMFTPQLKEPDFPAFASLNPPLPRRQRSWSGTAGLQADELCFETYRPYSQPLP